MSTDRPAGVCGNDYISLLLPPDWSLRMWFDSVCLKLVAKAVTLCERHRERARKRERERVGRGKIVVKSRTGTVGTLLYLLYLLYKRTLRFLYSFRLHSFSIYIQ